MNLHTRFFRHCILFLLFTPVLVQAQENGRLAGASGVSDIASHEDTPAMCVEYRWDSVMWDTSSVKTFTYFPDGKLAVLDDQTYGQGQTYTISDTFKYDSQGRILQRIHNEMPNGGPTFLWRYDYSHDQYDYQWKNGALAPQHTN